MRIKARHLEVFAALYDAGSVSRAAEQLHLSQPAVSIALRNLETTLGFRLFHRDRGYFAPTKEATLLHEEIRQGIVALARVEQRASEIRVGEAGGISVASNGVLAVNFLPRIIADYQRDHPGVQIELRVHSSRRVADWVGSRQIDIGLIDAPVPVAGLKARIVRMECVCVMGEDDALAKRKTVRPQDLDGRQVIAVTGDHGVDRQLARIMARADIRLLRSGSSYFYAIARNQVAAGGGIAMIDPINGKAALSDGVTWRPFRPAVVHELAMVTSRGQRPGLAAEGFEKRILEGLAAYALHPVSLAAASAADPVVHSP